jgi:hypothetical protein
MTSNNQKKGRGPEKGPHASVATARLRLPDAAKIIGPVRASLTKVRFAFARIHQQLQSFT